MYDVIFTCALVHAVRGKLKMSDVSDDSYLYAIAAAAATVVLLGVYTFRSSDRPVGPTGLSDWSVRRSYRVNASSDRSDTVGRIKHV